MSREPQATPERQAGAALVVLKVPTIVDQAGGPNKGMEPPPYSLCSIAASGRGSWPGGLAAKDEDYRVYMHSINRPSDQRKGAGMPQILRGNNRRLVILLNLLVAFALSECTLKLIADYDETVDKSTTEIQKKVETFLTRLERTIGTSAADYAQHVALYDEVRVDLSALKVRAAAIPQNTITVQQIDLLIDSWSTLEKLHILGFKNKEEISPLRRNFNQDFTQILKLELAKKRGG